MDETLTGTTTPGQSGPGSSGNEQVLHIPQSSRIGATPSDSLVSGWSYTSAKMQVMYFTDPVDWAELLFASFKWKDSIYILNHT